MTSAHPVVPGGLEFLVRTISQPQIGSEKTAYPTSHDGANFHTVRGVKRHGLLYDPGDSSGIIGTDAVREYVHDVLRPIGENIKTSPTNAQFTGIDGKPTPGIGKAIIPLKIPALGDASFTADMIGDNGSYCPGLFPLSSSIRYKASMFAGIFANHDGILAIFTVDKNTGQFKKTPTLIRLLHTDSGHHLIPTDTNDTHEESNQDFLRNALNECL